MQKRKYLGEPEELTIEQRIEDLKNSYEMNLIDKEMYDDELKDEKDTKKRMSDDDYNFYNRSQKTPKSKAKKEKTTKPKTTQNTKVDDTNCDNLQDEVNRLKKLLSEKSQKTGKTSQRDKAQSRKQKVKEVLTRQQKAKKPKTSAQESTEDKPTSETKKIQTKKQNSSKSGNKTSKPKTQTKPKTENTENTEKPKTKLQVKAKAEKEKEDTKKEAQNKGVSIKDGEAVRQFSVIRGYAQRFKGMLGKEMDATDVRVVNFTKKIKLDNEVRKFSKNSPQFEVALKIYTYLLNFTGGKFGEKMSEANINIIKEVANSEFLPLTITYIKKYINLSAKKTTPTKEEIEKLLDLMNNAKKRGAIKGTDISYAQFEKYRKNLENNKLEFDEELKGFVGKLSGLVSGLRSLGAIDDDDYSEKKKDNFEEVDYNTPPPSVMTTSEMMARGSEIYAFTGQFKELMGEPGRGFDVMIYGKPGNGKSTLALQLAEYLGDRYGDVLYVSSEQYDTASLKKNIAVNGIDSDYIYWAEALESEDLSKYEFVVIDSINNIDLDIEKFKAMKAKNRLTTFILIFQVTKGGIFKGSQEWEHEVDMVINVEQGEAEIEKNRFADNELGRISVWNKKRKNKK